MKNKKSDVNVSEKKKEYEKVNINYNSAEVIENGNDNGNDSLNEDEQKPKRPIIGIALGGGGSLGFAHIGVIKVLEENNIIPTKWAGTSMGAIVAAMYCYGYKAEKMFEISKKIRTRQFFDINFSGKGLLNGRGVERLLRKYIPLETRIQDLKFEYACNAVELYSGKEHVFTKGALLKAVRASFSVPGVFAPVKINNKLYVDAGIVNNVPDNIIKNMGADIIISVDIVNGYERQTKIKGVMDVIYLSTLVGQIELRRVKEKYSDVIIAPKLSKYKQYTFSKKHAEDMLRVGESAAKKALPEILQAIENFNIRLKNIEEQLNNNN